jgi:hypothetical protein
LNEMSSWFETYKKLIEKEKALIKTKTKIGSIQPMFLEETKISEKLNGNLNRLHKDEDGLLNILHHKKPNLRKK